MIVNPFPTTFSAPALLSWPRYNEMSVLPPRAMSMPRAIMIISMGKQTVMAARASSPTPLPTNIRSTTLYSVLMIIANTEGRPKRTRRILTGFVKMVSRLSKKELRILARGPQGLQVCGLAAIITDNSLLVFLLQDCRNDLSNLLHGNPLRLTPPTGSVSIETVIRIPRGLHWDFTLWSVLRTGEKHEMVL
jgi:hypothetical protein